MPWLCVEDDMDNFSRITLEGQKARLTKAIESIDRSLCTLDPNGEYAEHHRFILMSLERMRDSLVHDIAESIKKFGY